jgi:cytochrome c peroxidase
LHERGTRVPSLRRVLRKWPYFTNGSARSLDEVLERVAFTDDRVFHGSAPGEATRLGVEERAALAAFLRLL